MDIFEKIDELRKTREFPSKTYRRFLRKNNNSLESTLEINTSKYMERGTKSYLKKNIRLLKNKEDSEFRNLYLKYTEALLSKSCDVIVEVRNRLQNCPNFVDKLDEELNSLDFDTSSLKYKHNWKDLEILFTGEEKAKEFIKGEFVVQDTKYNSLLVKHIYKVEKKREQLDRLITKDSSRIRCIKSKINNFIKAIDSFTLFLESNYVESKYLIRTRKDSQCLLEAFGSLSEGQSLDNFEVPESFKNVEEEIQRCLKFPPKDKKKAKKQILDYLEKYFSTTVQMNVPFIPEFYDIAFDFIKFPPVDKNLEEVFTNLNLSQ